MSISVEWYGLITAIPWEESRRTGLCMPQRFDEKGERSEGEMSEGSENKREASEILGQRALAAAVGKCTPAF